MLWGSHGVPHSPNADAAAMFRLLTRHDRFNAHIFRFNLATSPNCVLCDSGRAMTAVYLEEGSALNDLDCIDGKYWRVVANLPNGLAFV
ncbi:hypothetical protein CDAR_249601 [Caerostris darwini]|uniref:Uncharacterized protein n=1 Tax=Caerostris darwini TaxID=1538125 RepID=A0AAV4RJB1_9ARAC|nr:hypothetical protein CDAR_249601 [Caerostris darwini]